MQPLWPGLSATVGDVCTIGACVGGNVLLPALQPIETAVDIEAPETLGALTIERIWTGRRDGLFGTGWESVWDVHLVDDRLVGPVPARPLVEPRAGHSVALDDGSSLHLDRLGRVDEACLDGTFCVVARRANQTITLTPTLDRGPGEPVVLVHVGGKVRSATYKGRSAVYRYDTEGRLVGVASDVGATTYQYSAGRLAAVEQESVSVPEDAPADAKITRTFGYDERGAVRSSRGLDGQQWSFSRAPALQPPGTATAPTTSAATTSTLGQDNGSSDYSGPPVRVVEAVSNGGVDRSFTFRGGVLVKVDDATCGVTLDRRLRAGSIVEEARPVDGVTMARLKDGRLRYTQLRPDSPPRVATMTLDDRDRVVRTESADGKTDITYAGDSSRPIRVKVGGQLATTLTYSGRGMLRRSVDADGYRVNVTRNAVGLPVRISDGVLTSSFTYDDRGRTTSEGAANRSRAVATYRPDGLVQKITDQSGRAFDASYSATGELTKLGGDDTGSAEPKASACSGDRLKPAVIVKDARGNGTHEFANGDRITFDDAGRPVRVTSSRRTTSRSYDEYGRLATVTQPDGTRYQLTYTAAGRLATVSDGPAGASGTVTANLAWHGDLLTGITTNQGSRYAYAYDAQGRMTKATAGSLAWDYQYDGAGHVTQVARPTGVTTFGWDASGRPVAAIDGDRTERYVWIADGKNLSAITIDGQEAVKLGRDQLGRVTEATTEDGEARFAYDASGRVSRFTLRGRDEVTVRYGNDNQVASLSSGGRVEHWTWKSGVLTTIKVEGDETPYALEWAAPGVLGKVTHGKEVLLSVATDKMGRPTEVKKGVEKDDQPLASMSWTRYGLMEATVGGWSMKATHDPEGRPIELAVGADKVSWKYDDGTLSSIEQGDDQVDFTYHSGRLTKSTQILDGRESTIEWDGTGARPVSVATDNGTTRFEYEEGRVETIRPGDEAKREQVQYDGEGSDQKASAPGDAGSILTELFDQTGRFERGQTRAADGPTSPWVESLPTDIGLALPDPITGTDVANGALSAAFPDTPTPLMGDPGNLADRVAGDAAAMGAVLAAPAAPDRFATLTPSPGEGSTGFGLGVFAGVRAAGFIDYRLAPDPGLVDRWLNWGADVIGVIGRGLGSGWDAVYGFITDTAFGRAALTAGFMALNVVGAVACGTMVVCVAGVGLGLVLAEGYVSAAGDGGPLGVMVDSVLQPYTSVRDAILARDPVAIVFSSVAAAGFVAGLTSSVVVRTYGPAVLAEVCEWQRVVCVSASRFGDAAEHVADAQRLGAPRLLKLDRTGAQARRSSALRSVPARAGLDRDEYPFAVSSARAGLSIRHIDPASNRSLGSYLGRQLRPLPDGARFYVLPIA